MFYNQLYAKYPSATYISTISVSSLTNPPAGIAQDDHLYDSAASFVGMFNKYDNANRNHPIFVAEYAAIYVAGVSGQIENPTLQTATAEAAFLLGLERNSDIVVGSSYGAYIKSLGDSPDNVATIKHSANAVVPSLSYYVQKLFATHHGVKTLPMSSNTAFGPVYWSSTISASGTYYVKIVNFNGAASTPITVTCTGNSKTTATLITLTAASESSSNSLGNMQQIWTETTVSASSAGVFSFTLSGTYISAVLVV
jgi:alpha-N-arabinofuranosidase